jgi:excisionase family DNA binding protein
MHKAETERRVFDVREAAKYIGLSERTVRTLIANGELRVARFGRSVRIAREDLDDLIERAKAARVSTTA